MSRPSILLVLLVLLALLVLAACGGAGASQRRAPAGPAIYDLTVSHESEMSDGFRLVGITVHVDGRLVYERSVDGQEDAVIETPICVLNQRVAAGSHELALELVYAGHGHGVFSYLDEYRFRVTSTHVADVTSEAFGVHVKSLGHENGGATTPLEDRPAVRWVEAPERSAAEAGCQPPAVLTP